MKTFVTLLAATIVAAATALAEHTRRRAAEIGFESLRCASGRLSDRGGGRRYRQETRESHQWPLSVQMYPSMQLGGEKEAIEQAQVGAIAFARVSVGALGPVIDELNVFNLPYVFRNTTICRM